jgi:hypothetical protein
MRLRVYASMRLRVYASTRLCVYASMRLRVYASTRLCVYASMRKRGVLLRIISRMYSFGVCQYNQSTLLIIMQSELQGPNRG